MKKFFPVLFLFFLLLSSIAYAAQAPERAGIVTDPIGLFTDREIAQLESALSGKEYDLYVLTASGLEESEGEALAWEAYDGWGLQGNELMLVITIDPNYVHLVFDNITLRNQIARSKAGDVTGVIERSFVPLASEGRIVDGVIALHDMILSIAAQNPSSSGNSSQGNVTPVPSNPTSPSTGTNTTASGSNTYAILFSLVGIVLIVVIFIAYAFYRRSMLRKKLHDCVATLEKSMQLTNRLVLSELFQELEQGFIQGETKKKLESLEQEIMPLRQQIQSVHQQAKEQKASIFALSSFARVLDQLKSTAQKLLKESNRYATEIEQLENATVEVRRQVQLAKERAQVLEKEVEQWASTTSFPLQTLRKQLQAALDATNSADHHDEFDILQAKKDVEIALQRLDEVDHHLKQLIEDKKKLEELPEYISNIEREQRFIVDKEKLLLVDANPFEYLEKARRLLPRMHELLEDGNSIELRLTINTAQQHIEDAVTVVQQMIEHREMAKQTLQKIAETRDQLAQIDQVYTREMNRLKQQYVQRHLDELEQYYIELKNIKQQLVELYEQIKKDNEETVQHYARAYQRSLMALDLITKAIDLNEKVISYVTKLDARLAQAKQELASLRSRFLKAVTTFEQLRLQRNPFANHITTLEHKLQNLDLWLRQAPYDLAHIETEMNTFRAEVDAFAKAVDELVKEKQKAERQLREFQDLYARSRSRYGPYIRLSSYNSTYEQMTRNIQQLIMMGMFAEAIKEISSGQTIIQQMEKEYRRQRNRHSGGGFGGGGFGGGSSGWGGGRSSGGSSWGGGRSSGSSGWGGGGGRSSGSSSWGRGGGRSSGSSKW